MRGISELSDAGGPVRSHCQLTRPARSEPGESVVVAIHASRGPGR